MLCVQGFHYFARSIFHGARNVVVRPNADASKETGKHQFPPAYVTCAGGHQIIAHHANVRAELKNVPCIFAENLKRRIFTQKRIAFPGDGFYQRRFSAAVRTENGDVLARSDRETQPVQGVAISTQDMDICKADERCGFGKWRLKRRHAWQDVSLGRQRSETLRVAF